MNWECHLSLQFWEIQNFPKVQILPLQLVAHVCDSGAYMISVSGAMYTNQERFTKFLNAFHSKTAIHSNGTGP